MWCVVILLIGVNLREKMNLREEEDTSIYKTITRLRWTSPSGEKPGTFREWVKKHPYREEFSWCKVLEKEENKKRNIVILVDTTIIDTLLSDLSLLMEKLSYEGFSPSVYSIKGGTHDSLRNFLFSLYKKDSIEGALLIGYLPIAWFQVEHDWELGYAEWPIDLFYMDLDGVWEDSYKKTEDGELEPGSDSIYDYHSGEREPEIYVGRLIPTGIGEEIALIKNYIKKNINYRDYSIALPRKALLYIDDDWAEYKEVYCPPVALLYKDTTIILDSNITRAVDYKRRLDATWAWVSVYVHSWPGGHAFYYNNYTEEDYFYGREYFTQNPMVNFYNYFACSFARYTTNNYGAGCAIFAKNWSVGAIGCTKVGSMLEFEYFYKPLGEGKTLGEAFKDWFTEIIEDLTWNKLLWHYGMTLIGDPFLRPTGHPIKVKLISPEPGGIVKVKKDIKYVWYKAFDGAKYRLKIDDDESVEVTDTFYVDPTERAVGEHTFKIKSGTQHGVWGEYEVYSFEIITGVEEEEVSVFNYYLAQNAPNPFKENTIIRYGLKERGKITIGVYNLLGEKVATIVEGEKKKGEYWVKWEGVDEKGKKLPTGVYFCKMEANGFRQVKKLYIIR